MKMRLVLAMVLLSIGPAQNAIWGADREPVAMRPLRVVEARRAIHGPAPVTIEEPGSYYLASNIDAAGLPAVIIKAPDVNLDLNGFTIAGSQDNLGVVFGIETSSAAGPFPDLSIAGNFATGNGLGNYTLAGANAAPVATLASNPGAWANVQ